MEEPRQKVKDRILYLLKMQGAQTATALADQLQVSPMAIRQHLQSLRAEGQVIYQQERRPLGRPVKLWQLTGRSGDHFPDSHADLMLDILRSVETVFGEAGLDRLITDRSQRQIQTYQTKIASAFAAEQANQDSWQTRVRAIAHLRTQEGYMAEVLDQPDGSLLLVENHCPICTAAQQCQKLCGAEMEVFQAVLGEGVKLERVEHILRGDRRCAYRIQPA
ncbi:MAG: transcriptional regulator [Oculatellaceae cyanobacterium Prado106]|nr:transcriptional regulator [Oculatellaceae cyanobacterium Prado106]